MVEETRNASDQGFRLKGWHVFAGFAGAFTIIIGVNLVLAFSAVRTFPGLETETGNGYVASQTFNDRKAAQEALGWSVRADHINGRVVLSITDEDGGPVKVDNLHAVVGRATHVFDDVEPEFQFDGERYVAALPLEDGNWNIRMTAEAGNGTVFQQRVILHVQ